MNKMISLILLIVFGMILLINFVFADTRIFNPNFCAWNGSNFNVTSGSLNNLAISTDGSGGNCSYSIMGTTGLALVTNSSTVKFPTKANSGNNASWYCLINLSVVYTISPIAGRAIDIFNGSTGGAYGGGDFSAGLDTTIAIGNSCDAFGGVKVTCLKHYGGDSIVSNISINDGVFTLFNVTSNGSNISIFNVVSGTLNASLATYNKSVNYLENWRFGQPDDNPTPNITISKMDCYNSTIVAVPDTTPPKNLLSINTTNPKINYDINYSTLCTDETALLSGSFSVNTSGTIKYSNYTLSGTSTNITNGTTITTPRGSVINVTSYCTDTSNNVQQNSILIIIVDTLSTINLGLNLTSIKINNVQNISCNATDPDAQFSQGIVALNLSGNPYLNFSFTPFDSGYSLFNFSQAQSFNLTRGNVINSTCLVNDTFGTTVQASTKSTILDTLGSILLGTNITTIFRFGSVGNFSGNVTEFDRDISSGLVSYNISGNPQLNFSFIPAQTGYNYFNFSQAIIINKTRGTPINFTLSYNDNAGTFVQTSILLIVNNTPPVIVNVSLSDLPVSAGSAVKGHGNFTDIDLDLPTGNETKWYLNKTELPTANNTFILNAPNVTNNANITFSIRYNDTEFSNWTNSTTATVGDLTAPTITNQSISGGSFTTNDNINLSATCTDNIAVTSAFAEVNFTNISLTNLGNNVWADARTYALGNHNVTNFYCLDGNGNRARDLSNITFIIAPAGSSGSSNNGGGGGGGGSPTITTTVILGNLSLKLEPPILSRYFLYTPFKSKLSKFAFTFKANKELDKCISLVYNCEISNGVDLTISLNYQNDTAFINNVKADVTLLDKAGLAKTITPSVTFINLGYAIPIDSATKSTNYVVFRLNDFGIVQGIRLWFLAGLIAVITALVMLWPKFT